jgi:hypothetical protein
MNERIEDIARQCMSMRFFVDTASEEFDYKKFAELLVQECVATIVNDTANYQGEGMMAYYQGVQDAGKSIKHRFGVEE